MVSQFIFEAVKSIWHCSDYLLTGFLAISIKWQCFYLYIETFVKNNWVSSQTKKRLDRCWIYVVSK